MTPWSVIYEYSNTGFTYLYTIRRSGSPNFLAIRVLFQHVFRDCAAFETFGEGMGRDGGGWGELGNRTPIHSKHQFKHPKCTRHSLLAKANLFAILTASSVTKIDLFQFIRG